PVPPDATNVRAVGSAREPSRNGRERMTAPRATTTPPPRGLGEERYVMYLPSAGLWGDRSRRATPAIGSRRLLGVSMKSLPQWSATFLLATPFGAWALGLGDIELQSALNQP